MYNTQKMLIIRCFLLCSTKLLLILQIESSRTVCRWHMLVGSPTTVCERKVRAAQSIPLPNIEAIREG